MRILVTGANGFIGRHLVADLCRQHDITGLLHAKPDQDVVGASACVLMDLGKPLDAKSLPGRIDVVIHLAQANVSFPEGAAELLAVNTIATQQLLEYAQRAGARQFVLASSGDVYGHRVGLCRETDCVAPKGYYAVTKHAAELLLGAYSDYVRCCVIRLFHPYGPGQRGRLVPKLAERIRQGNPIRLGVQDRPHLTPIFVADVVHAIERILDCSFCGTLNVSGDEAVTIRELAHEISNTIGKVPAFEQTDEQHPDLMGDNRLMKQALGEWNMIKLGDGLLRTLGGENECQARV